MKKIPTVFVRDRAPGPGHREPIAVALCLAALAAWPYRAHLGALIEGVNA